MHSLLSVRNVNKSFGALKAVQGISLDVPVALVTAVVGPNGAGKTTLFNCISGIAQPDQAEILLHPPDRSEQIAIARLDVEQISRLGIARTFQHRQRGARRTATAAHKLGCCACRPLAGRQQAPQTIT
jgi:branched-chain amino acid transport system ATP-binding protein